MATTYLYMTVFPLGRVVITHAALEALAPEAVHTALTRHGNADWGDLCEEDWKWNDQALLIGERLFSVFFDRETKFYVITEWDRSVTTILLPADY